MWAFMYMYEKDLVHFLQGWMGMIALDMWYEIGCVIVGTVGCRWLV